MTPTVRDRLLVGSAAAVAAVGVGWLAGGPAVGLTVGLGVALGYGLAAVLMARANAQDRP